MWKCVIVFIISKTVSAQLNGEFWWLNDKIKQIKGFESSPVKIEDDTGYENDDTDRILFDNNKLTADFKEDTRNNNSGGSDINLINNIKFADKTIIVWPTVSSEILNTNREKKNSTSNYFDRNKINKDAGDELVFKFPDDELFSWKGLFISKKNKTTENKSHKDNAVTVPPHNDDHIVHFKPYNEESKLAENICTYMKKVQCNQINGNIYIPPKSYQPKETYRGSSRVCCILPLPKSDLDSGLMSTRSKRSIPADQSSGLRQRDTLMLRNIHLQKDTESKPIKPTLSTKIVTQKIASTNDDYDDPYWNIKNTNPRAPQTSNPYGLSPDDVFDEVEDDSQVYVDEVPKPGLTGLYSDNGPNPASWTFMDPNTKPPYSADSDSIEEEGLFGYSTINPRLVAERTTATVRPFKRKLPQKFTTSSSDEITYNVESHTIRYQSQPDFQVLQGYKLLNLYRNRSKIYYKTGSKGTESLFDKGSEGVFSKPSSIDYSEEDYGLSELGQQVYGDCGKSTSSFKFRQGPSVLSTKTDNRSHPWLGLVVLTQTPQSILCYATIIHPKAAVTVGDCAYGKNAIPQGGSKLHLIMNCRRSKGEMTLIVGVRDLSESQTSSQTRLLLAILHPKFKPGQLANNIALLYWKRPLNLDETVHPVCLSDPHVGDKCRFVGWGGYDQDIKPRPSWQRAVVLAPKQCSDSIQASQDLPSDTFCAAVDSRNSVTGVGGPLVCEVGGRQAAVGVAVRRGRALILQSPREWALHAAARLNL